jgi:preprotein translocase subunit SecF
MNLRHAIATYRGHTIPHFQIIEHRNRWFIFSGVLIVLSLIGLIFVGLNYSIDFTGGTQISFPVKTDVTVSDIQSSMDKLGLTGAEVQFLSGPEGDEYSVRTESLDPNQHTEVRNQLAKDAGVDVSEINIESIGPTWGAQISRKALIGLIVVLLAITAYIALRFEFKMAVGAMIALVHDVVITAGIYALVNREVTPETVIAILTILGYSLYDTVVIYDKVKENTESPVLVSKYGYAGVVNLSLNQVLMRSVNTSLVVLLPILSLMLFGGETLKDFAFAMFIGVAIGAYSSIFIAAPVLTILKSREKRYQQLEARRAAKEAAVTPAKASPALPEAAAVSATARTGGSSSRPRPKSNRRPPAKRKRR